MGGGPRQPIFAQDNVYCVLMQLFKSLPKYSVGGVFLTISGKQIRERIVEWM